MPTRSLSLVPQFARYQKKFSITTASRLKQYSLQAFSSDSSLQSGLPLQKSSLSTHSPLPHESLPSGQTGSSVLRMGSTLRGSANVILVNGPTRRLRLLNQSLLRDHLAFTTAVTSTFTSPNLCTEIEARSPVAQEPVILRGELRYRGDYRFTLPRLAIGVRAVRAKRYGVILG